MLLGMVPVVTRLALREGLLRKITTLFPFAVIGEVFSICRCVMVFPFFVGYVLYNFVVVLSPFISYILQCYDEYLRKCLEKAVEAMGISTWGIPPDGPGSYNDEHVDTNFFCYCGDYNGPYGRFFLNWYSQYLIDNGDRVLTKAKLAFGDTLISVKVSIYWWYETNGHAAEMTAGYYNPVNRDGYAPIASLLKKHEAL
ncbi:putative beta-amylase [Helianthus anomalus]